MSFINWFFIQLFLALYALSVTNIWLQIELETRYFCFCFFLGFEVQHTVAAFFNLTHICANNYLHGFNIM